MDTSIINNAAVKGQNIIKSVNLHEFYVKLMRFDGSGRFLALGGVKGGIKIFDLKTKQQTHDFNKHTAGVTYLEFSHNL